MSDIEVNFQTNGEEIGELFEQACERALTRIGLQGESFAKGKCPVDTGNLEKQHIKQSRDEREIGIHRNKCRICAVC